MFTLVTDDSSRMASLDECKAEATGVWLLGCDMLAVEWIRGRVVVVAVGMPRDLVGVSRSQGSRAETHSSLDVMVHDERRKLLKEDMPHRLLSMFA